MVEETNYKEQLLDAGPGKQPLYSALAGILKRDIENGKYETGSVFPSEKELTERYSVSRQTVREALRIIREDGLIASHAGVGTTVRAAGQKPMFSPMNSVESLLSFVENTQMHAVGVTEVEASKDLAEKLECKEGLTLSQAGFLRKLPGEELPMSYVLVYVKPRYAQAQHTAPVSNAPIYKNIEAMFGVRVHEIRQDISAINLDADLAKILQAAVGDPALLMTRFYYDINNKLIQTSLSYYPGERYTQSARFRATK